VELSVDDACLENVRVPCGWQHGRFETCNGMFRLLYDNGLSAGFYNGNIVINKESSAQN